MPSGYTEPVQKGDITEFSDFALRCARGMGALILMRDEPLDAEIPVFQPSDHHGVKLGQAKERLAELEKASDAEITAMRDSEYKTAFDLWKDSCKEKAEWKSRYQSMLRKVRMWTPPTPDHQGLKEYMEKQFSDSIDWDCSDWEMPRKLSPEEWKEQEFKKIYREIAYHEREGEEEVSRTNTRYT